MQDTSQIWWKEITGPKAFINDVAERLLESSVIVKVPDDLPWRHEMRQEIQSELRDQSDYREITVVQIDAEDVTKSGKDVCTYILDSFALKETTRQYRKKSGKSIPQFIVEKNILSNFVLWVKGFNNESAFEWLDFLLQYNACSPRIGRIVLELRDDIIRPPQNTIEEIDYSTYISEYNLQLFSSILLDRIPEYAEDWKRYISALASHLCVTDAEIAECFIIGCNHTEKDPLEMITAISLDPEYLRRGAGQGSSHILSFARNYQISKIQRRIWEAQVQVLFPIVESKRVRLIEQIEDELKVLLRAREIRQFGEIIENPYDMEWGTLAYSMSLKNLEYEYYLVSLTDVDRAMIQHFREIRNTLAHGDCCSVEQVNEILSTQSTIKNNSF